MPINLEMRKFEGVADTTTYYQTINAAPRHEGDWLEITDGVYYEQLEMMPPLAMGHGGFICCEAHRGALHSCFFHIDGRFFEALLDCRSPKAALEAGREAILMEISPDIWRSVGEVAADLVGSKANE